jgi:hypothetical protein
MKLISDFEYSYRNPPQTPSSLMACVLQYISIPALNAAKIRQNLHVIDSFWYDFS